MYLRMHTQYRRDTLHSIIPRHVFSQDMRGAVVMATLSQVESGGIHRWHAMGIWPVFYPVGISTSLDSGFIVILF